jgi:hypothetical protein
MPTSLHLVYCPTTFMMIDTLRTSNVHFFTRPRGWCTCVLMTQVSCAGGAVLFLRNPDKATVEAVDGSTQRSDFCPIYFLHIHQAHARIPMSDIDRQADNQGFTLGIVGWRCCVFGFLALVASIPCCAPAGSKGGNKLPCIYIYCILTDYY